MQKEVDSFRSAIELQPPKPISTGVLALEKLGRVLDSYGCSALDIDEEDEEEAVEEVAEIDEEEEADEDEDAAKNALLDRDLELEIRLGGIESDPEDVE